MLKTLTLLVHCWRRDQSVPLCATIRHVDVPRPPSCGPAAPLSTVHASGSCARQVHARACTLFTYTLSRAVGARSLPWSPSQCHASAASRWYFARSSRASATNRPLAPPPLLSPPNLTSLLAYGSVVPSMCPLRRFRRSFAETSSARQTPFEAARTEASRDTHRLR